MNNIITIFFTLFTISLSLAQTETLSAISSYPNIQPIKSSTSTHKYLVDKGNVVVTSDTLQLPFIDDFSTNRMRTYKWLENNYTDTFFNVIGTCLGNENITTQQVTLRNDTSWYYTFDTANLTVDSFPQPAQAFTFFGPATNNCFSATPQTIYYWPEYFRYFYNTNTSKFDSVFITNPPSEILFYAPVVYFANGQPGTLWFDNYAYVNSTYPILPPSIGVATLDGLNELGLPYNNASNNTYGDADVLTSKGINLSGLSEGDSVYLSFFYEPKGLGDFPDSKDSLIVEFKDIGDIWWRAWARPGYAVPNQDSVQFNQVMLLLPDRPLQNSYFHNNFQFRIRNKASLYGALDHWHLDYVKLDKNRSAVDTVIQDVAFIYPYPTILKNFTQLPADQFTGNIDLVDSISMLVRNNDPNAINNPPATNFAFSAQETYPTPVVVLTPTTLAFNAEPFKLIEVNPAADYVILTSPNWPVDSLVINSQVSISPNDSRPQNDTLRQVQSFSTTMAYDDGSAEAAYGITGNGTKKFGYEFILNQPDTLVGFQVMFTQVEQNVSNLVFNYHVWDSLKLNDFAFVDAPIKSVENKKPFYVDSVNGFYTYKLDTPIIVSGRVFFGWAQFDERNLQVGYDLNSPLGNPHMYVQTFGTWKKSTITTPGSPMIRLIFDTDYYGGTTNVQDLSKNERPNVSVYPNPTTGVVYLQSATSHLQVDLFNIMGSHIANYQNIQIFDIGNLTPGIYIARIHSEKSDQAVTHKIIKQ
jgi:hypothetical protein